VIRNWSTKQFEAIYSLPGRNRWCVTGTPIQNSLEDLGALVRFTRLPFLEEPMSFRRHIINRIKLTDLPTEINLENLEKLLKSICLRRTNTLLQLPGIIHEECRPELTPEERNQYNELVRICNAALEQSFCRQLSAQGTTGVLECLLDLRMYCNHGLKRSNDDAGQRGWYDEFLSLLQQRGEAACAYCQCDILTLNEELVRPDGPFNAPYMTECHRIICKECAPRYMDEDSGSSRRNHHRCLFCNGRKCKEGPVLAAPKASKRTKEQFTPSKLLALTKNIQENIENEKWFVSL
jgi:SWI/SNF-related matrix-associated actin-dependent regulator of chromatin subfamily A3